MKKNPAQSFAHFRHPANSAEEFVPWENFQLVKYHPEYETLKDNKKRRWTYNNDGSVFPFPEGEGDIKKKKYCQKLLKASRETAIDIGANIGDWSRWMLTSFKNVIAFEPQPIWREAFIHNVDMSNVVLYPYALSNQNHNVSMNHMILTDNEGGPYESRTLDSFDIKEKIDFIKIDIEGWELYALKGAHETLLKNKPVLIVEQKGDGGRGKSGRRKGLSYEPRKTSNFLKKLGYKKAGQISADYIYEWRK